MKFPLLSKALALIAVFALLSLVLFRIEGLADERHRRQQQAQASVEQSLAGPQTLLGPLLHRSCSEEWDVVQGAGKERQTSTHRRSFVLSSTPHELKVNGSLQAEPRYRGLFKINGYSGQLVLNASWPSLTALQPTREQLGSRLQCGPLRMMVSLSDVRGLRQAEVRLDSEVAKVEPGTEFARHPSGLHVVVSPARTDSVETPLAAKVTLDLLGTAQLSLVPAAGQTNWSLRSDWPHPSFIGRFLPQQREVTEQGFQASWAVNSLASSAARDVLREGRICAVTRSLDPEVGEWQAASPAADKAQPCLDTLGLAFIDPVNPYVLSDRAIKYATLFIVLTFACVALTEVLSRRRVHPVQYTLLGLALALFFLLLLSLSEHLGFTQAYGLASVACISLLSFYARHLLGQWRAGLAFGAGVGLLYGALWVLLRMEQTALVVGSLLLFAALTAVMVLTRRVDWYELFRGLRSQSDAPA
jgi:inner membrane protein